MLSFLRIVKPDRPAAEAARPVADHTKEVTAEAPSHTPRVAADAVRVTPDAGADDLPYDVIDSEPGRMADYFAWCEEYHTESDPLIGNSRTWPQIWGSYNEYCEYAGRRPMAVQEFARQLKHAGITKYQRRREDGKQVWLYRFTGLVKTTRRVLGPSARR